MSKRGETGTEYPVIVVIEILLAIFVGYLFVDTAKSYASQEIFYKQEIAKEIGLVIDSLPSIRENAYVEFNDFYNYLINIDNDKVEVSSKTRDFTPGIYYFVAPKGNNINPKNKNFDNPVNFVINKQGRNIFVDDAPYNSNKLNCDKNDKLKKVTEPISLYLVVKKDSEEFNELGKISEGLKGSIKYSFYDPQQFNENRFLLALNIQNFNSDNTQIKAYVIHNSKSIKEALSISCFIINELIERVYSDSYIIIPIDVNRIDPSDPKSILKNKDFAIYLELGNIGSKNYHKSISDVSVSIIKGIEEYSK